MQETISQADYRQVKITLGKIETAGRRSTRMFQIWKLPPSFVALPPCQSANINQSINRRALQHTAAFHRAYPPNPTVVLKSCFIYHQSTMSSLQDPQEARPVVRSETALLRDGKGVIHEVSVIYPIFKKV